MIYANEEIFNIDYNTDLDELKIKKSKRKSKIMNFMKCHKFFTTVVTLFSLFSCINFVLIYNFIEILKNIC